MLKKEISEKIIVPLGDKGVPGERDDMFNSQVSGKVERYKHLQRYIYAAKKIGGDKKVLDVGCGTGYGTKMIFDKGNETYGLDISEAAINYAKKKYPGPKYICCSAEEIPFPDNYFDAITAFEVIEHVQNPEKTLDEIYRVLKLGGDLFISTPNPRHLKNVFLHYFFKKPYPLKSSESNIYHLREFYYEEFMNLLEKKRFRIISRYGQYLPLFPWPISGILNKISVRILIFLGYFFPKYAETIVVHARK
jgi:ubiquinone/menaquinone biosynthesis C-methylase UbiE